MINYTLDTIIYLAMVPSPGSDFILFPLCWIKFCCSSTWWIVWFWHRILIYLCRLAFFMTFFTCPMHLKSAITYSFNCTTHPEHSCLWSRLVHVNNRQIFDYHSKINSTFGASGCCMLACTFTKTSSFRFFQVTCDFVSISSLCSIDFRSNSSTCLMTCHE